MVWGEKIIDCLSFLVLGKLLATRHTQIWMSYLVDIKLLSSNPQPV